MPGNNVLPDRIIEHHHVPGRLILPGRDGRADRMSQRILLPVGELPTGGLRSRYLLSGRLRDLYFLSAGVVRQRKLKQHVLGEGRCVRRGEIASFRF